jgi:capsular exopolysaccharide synthesis family protein
MMTQPLPPSPSRQPHPPADDIDLLKYFYLFLKNLHWFALAVIVCLGVAYMVNKHGAKIYKVTSTVLVEDQSNSPAMGSMFGGSDVMSGFGLYPSYYNFQNQILIMKSESLISKTLHELDFQVSYFKDKIWGRYEILSEAPFIVVPNYGKTQPLGVRFKVEIREDGTIKIESETVVDKVESYDFLTEKTIDAPQELNLNKTVKFGEMIEGNGYSFTLEPRNEKEGSEKVKPGKYMFYFNSFGGLISSWSENLALESLDKDASMVGLTVQTECPEKAKLFLNKHTDMYLQRTLDKKNQVATNTINFIDSQLVTIEDSLNITGMNLQDYRKNNQVVDLSFQSQKLFEQTKELDNQKAALKMKDDYFRYLLEYIARNKEAGDLVAPSVMGIEDASLNSLVLELNRMADQKIAMAGTGASENPYIGTINSQIKNAKARLEENARNLLNNNYLAMKDVNSRLNVLMAEVRKLPQTERELLGIERKFKLNDNIYTYLLQRRAEAQIAKASNTPDNEVIDQASLKAQIKPKPMRNYSVALMLGLLIPGLLLVIIDSFNNKVSSEDDIKKISDLPVAGHIIHSFRDYQTVVLNDPKSQVAETFRSLRTRLQFFTKETSSPVILITSSMPAEGKTFASINLASAYSLVGKKTVLVGFDLRKPKIYTDFNINNDKGVSTFLIGQNTVEEIINNTDYQNLWVIPAGPVPPNPAELAASAKTRELFAELKKRFDYIVIDSAPLGSVSDSFSLAAVSDITVILVRHNVTIKHVLHNAVSDAKSNGISGMSLLLNDISRERTLYGYTGRYKYGYGYGYGYETYTNGKGKS